MCVWVYSPSTTKFDSPFELDENAIVEKRPYNLTRQKMWLKQELRSILNSDINLPPVFPFALAYTLAPKEDVSIRLCRDYRAVNHRTSLIYFALPRIDAVIEVIGAASTLQGLTCVKGSGKCLCENVSRL